MLSRLFNKVADNQDQASVSFGLREKRFSTFLTLLDVSENDRIVDVGGANDIWLNSGLEQNVTIVNIGIAEKHTDEHGITHLPGDACNMPMFDDNQFDVAFSNSVIEHVGDISQQQKFATEVKRIAPKYWVQTPYKHFPIEPHFLFPFFEYLPKKLKHFVGTRWKYSHYKQRKRSEEFINRQIEMTRLLSNNEMKQLFADGNLYKEKVLGLPKSIVLYRT